jgi:hypothetical protein
MKRLTLVVHPPRPRMPLVEFVAWLRERGLQLVPDAGGLRAVRIR